MNLEMTPEVVASQLQLGNTKANIDLVSKAIANTKNFDKFAKHILSLNDKLKHINSYIALSNSHPYFKIKCEIDDKTAIDEFHQIVEHWGSKHHIVLQKVQNKEVYYIIGKE